MHVELQLEIVAANLESLGRAQTQQLHGVEALRTERLEAQRHRRQLPQAGPEDRITCLRRT